jgi:succinate dehydrogenase/fumarate reductase flavoprotein subunit
VAFAEIFGLGPIAGANAAAYVSSGATPGWDEAQAAQALEESDAPLNRHGDGVRPFEMKQAIQRVMSGKLGPVRTGSELDGAVLELEGLRCTLPQSMTVAGGEKRYSRERMDALEVPLMIETALMIASSARMRTESRGSHFRTDYP